MSSHKECGAIERFEHGCNVIHGEQQIFRGQYDQNAVSPVNEGTILKSIHASRGLLEFQAVSESPSYNAVLDLEHRIVLCCGTGGRSVLAAKTLLEMGFKNVASLAGGYAAWQSAQKL